MKFRLANESTHLREYFQIAKPNESKIVDASFPHRIGWITPLIAIFLLFGFYNFPSFYHNHISASSEGNFQLLSPAFVNNGQLPVNYTCTFNKTDYTRGVSPPLYWVNQPLGVEEYAIILSSLNGKIIQYSWVYYSIPKSVTALEANTTVGRNYKFIRERKMYDEYKIQGVFQPNGYSSPCSKGSGRRVYDFTIFALSKRMIDIVPRNDYNANNITAESYVYYMRNYTLASASISGWSVHY